MPHDSRLRNGASQLFRCTDLPLALQGPTIRPGASTTTCSRGRGRGRRL